MAVVCQCDWITDAAVRRAVMNGARRVADVTATCGAGRDCGACHDTIEEIIEIAVGIRTSSAA